MMKKLKLLLLLLLFCASTTLVASELNSDSTVINIRIFNALKFIQNDTLFQNYMEKEFGKPKSFLIDDTLTCPFISTTVMKMFYPDSCRWFWIYKNNYFQDCYKEFKKDPVVKISEIYKNKNSNYIVYIGIMDLSSQNFIIFPINPKKESRGYEIFILYDDNNNVLRYYSHPYIVNE